MSFMTFTGILDWPCFYGHLGTYDLDRTYILLPSISIDIRISITNYFFPCYKRLRCFHTQPTKCVLCVFLAKPQFATIVGTFATVFDRSEVAIVAAKVGQNSDGFFLASSERIRAWH